MRFGFLFLAATGLSLSQPAAFAQPAAAGKPLWLYAHDLKVRKGGESDWDKAAKLGVEVFKDAGTGMALAITQAGQLATAPIGEVGANKQVLWLFGRDLHSRKADEDRFNPNTAKYGVEVYKDAGSGKFLYLSQAAGVAFADAKVGSTDKDPEWHHGLKLKVRAPKEETFGPNTAKFGVEVFKDGNTGDLIYITETGLIAIAAAPATPPAKDAVKKPTALYALNLRARKADELDWTDKTKTYGIEVYKDENTNSLIYIVETGAIAVVPAPAAVKEKQGVEWKRSMLLKPRPGGETSYAKANRFGIEVFLDKNTGNTIFLSDVGGIAVVPAKK
jgi:hypothetical protein